jgi:hypothetical protein
MDVPYQHVINIFKQFHVSLNKICGLRFIHDTDHRLLRQQDLIRTGRALLDLISLN